MDSLQALPHCDDWRRLCAISCSKLGLLGLCILYIYLHTDYLLHLLLDAEHLDQSKGSSGSETTDDHRAGRSVQVSSPTTSSSPVIQRRPSHVDFGSTYVKYVLKPPKMNSTTPVTMHEMVRPSSADDVAMYGMSGMRPPMK